MNKTLFAASSLTAVIACLVLGGLALLRAARTPAPSGPTPAPQNETVTALKGARLIDGTGRPARTDSVLILKGDRIVSVGAMGRVPIPAGAREIDVRGRTIIPGLINAHGHVGLVLNGQGSAEAYTREIIAQALKQYEEYGVTSILSLGANRDLGYDLRDEQRRGTFPGATLFTAGRGIGVPDGAPPLLLASDQVYRPKTTEEARAAVRETAAHHPDMLKLWVDDVYSKYPKMKPEMYQAVIEEAHRQAVRVAAHVFYLADAKALVSAGVDALAHSIRDKPVDSELIAMMKARGVWYIPTLTVEESQFIFAEDTSLMQGAYFEAAVSPDVRKQLDSDAYRKKVGSEPNLPRIKAALAMGMQNLKALHDAGVKIALGTDSGANFTRVPGWSEHHELELMTRAGLTPMEAIVAATQGSAAVLGAADLGTLEAGKRADFLVLAKNPLDSIGNTTQIVSIWHGGKEIAPRVAAPATQGSLK
jgi:imidazolonepropionase-like amidohydrolase